MISVSIATLDNPLQAKALVELLDAYAHHPMGGGKGLSDYARANLAANLAQRDDVVVILAFDKDTAIGLCNCIEGFSTFACRPLLNIHDVYVAEDYRGQGVAQKMMQLAEQIARNRGCCKMTLEVLNDNTAAKASYRASGYRPYQLDDRFGAAEFWEKPLAP